MTTSFGEKEFNPPENRLEVLEHCGILSYIKSTVFGGIVEDEKDGKRKEKRMKQNRDDDVSDCQSSMSKWAYCDLGCNEGDLPESEKAGSEVLSLPLYPELPDDDIRLVCKNILEFLENN